MAAPRRAPAPVPITPPASPPTAPPSSPDAPNVNSPPTTSDPSKPTIPPRIAPTSAPLFIDLKTGELLFGPQTERIAAAATFSHSGKTFGGAAHGGCHGVQPSVTS